MGKNLKHVKQAKEAFMKMWECQDLGEAKEFLKMKIQHTGHKLILDQHDYLDKIVTQFDLKGSYSVNTPLPTGYEPEENKGTATQAFCLEYQSVIVEIMQAVSSPKRITAHISPLHITFSVYQYYIAPLARPFVFIPTPLYVPNPF